MTTGARDTPAAEVEIDLALVRLLLRAQHPDLADLPLERVRSGWDNVIFRLGDDLVVRLPRRSAAAALVEHEQRWLPILADRLPLAIPVPLRTGTAAHGYPWSWSVCRWRPGDVAANTPPSDAIVAARTLGAFLRALHVPAPAGAPDNPYRGVPLARRSDLLAEHLGRVASAVDAAAVRVRWDELVAASPWSGPPVWLHGDLHPANIVVHDGAVVAVIDFGDITAGDPATDLAVAWMLLPAEARSTLRAASGDVDDATWQRARGWALAHALACLANSADDPGIRGIGERTLHAVLDDDNR